MPTSSTSNSKMAVLRLIIPLVAIVFCLSRSGRWIAWLTDIEYVEYSALDEGNRIVESRKQFLEYGLPENVPIAFAGSSRLMADFSPNVAVEQVRTVVKLDKAVRAYNFGNIAQCYDTFEKRLTSPQPRLLILEYSPTMMVGPDCDQVIGSLARKNGLFDRYRSSLDRLERSLSASVRGALGIDEFPKVHKHFSRFALGLLSGDLGLTALYIYLRASNGYGQVLQPDGQTIYRVYLPNREAAQIHRNIIGSEFELYAEGLKRDWSRKQWMGLHRLTERYSSPGYQLVVVRAPVSPELYELENNLQRDQLHDVVTWLAKNKIQYMDMNPNAYFVTDMSHLDWFDTPTASKQLGDWLARKVQWQSIQLQEPALEKPLANPAKSLLNQAQ